MTLCLTDELSLFLKCKCFFSAFRLNRDSGIKIITFLKIRSEKKVALFLLPSSLFRGHRHSSCLDQI